MQMHNILFCLWLAVVSLFIAGNIIAHPAPAVEAAPKCEPCEQLQALLQPFRG